MQVSAVANAGYLIGFSMWPFGTLAAAALSIGCGWLLIQLRADRQRAKAFDARDAPNFSDWYARYYSDSPDPPDKTFVEKALDAFGEAFGIIPTRLRPSDRIENELRLKGTLSLDDAWETVDALLAGKLDKSFSWSRDWRTLDDVIRGLAAQWQARA